MVSKTKPVWCSSALPEWQERRMTKKEKTPLREGHWVIWRVRYQLELEHLEVADDDDVTDDMPASPRAPRRAWKDAHEEQRVIGGVDGMELVERLRAHHLGRTIEVETEDGASEARVTGFRLLYLKPVSHATSILNRGPNARHD